ncbi:hypothetical protein [Streptomyces sp. NRRL S-118]|uniref:hypothetical protein n=1 Tax=Streptomyces sp. NRRL S-118 TaxID=1463881 RepID=UPI000B2F314D|nr:hypothetical protein [Streptomyces sp. NRRL S-118]
MAGAEAAAGGGGQVAVVLYSGGDLTGFTETAAGTIQHRVGVWPAQGFFGVAGEGFGVDAKDLGEGGVAFDVGPCG